MVLTKDHQDIRRGNGGVKLTCMLGTTATMVMPYAVKKKRMMNMKKTYQKNLPARASAALALADSSVSDCCCNERLSDR